MDQQVPKPLILILAFFQGVVLTLLYLSAEHHVWPGTQPVWLVSLATFAISMPLLTFLTVTKDNVRFVMKTIVPFSLLLATIGAYVGLQMEPVERISSSSATTIFIMTSLVACFKWLMYVQQGFEKLEKNYANLFTLSWRNFVIAFECWLFVLIFFGILHLGAALFSVLNIDFFEELLKKEWFVIPVLNLALGFAVIVFRSIGKTADTIASVLQALIKFLLPVLTIVSLGFIGTLPFTGLSPLWETGSGSLLVMWLQLLTLFFVNAVYQQGGLTQPYGVWLHRLILIGVAILPIYSVIACYGLWLRVEQYGWTVDRCWAALIWLFLTTFSISYLIGIVKKRDEWLTTLCSVNVKMGYAVLFVMLLVNTPLLNFQSISANSQIARISDEVVSKDSFDYRYFKYSLGRQGYLAIEELKNSGKPFTPELEAILQRLFVVRSINGEPKEEELTVADLTEITTFYPDQSSFDTSLLEAVLDDEKRYFRFALQDRFYYFLRIDLNEDGVEENVVITESNTSTSADIWAQHDDKWKSYYIRTNNPNSVRLLKTAFIEKDIQTVAPKWQVLKIGDVTFQVPNGTDLSAKK